MKKDLTELVFILDRSGSMAGLESDTIGGYNAMLKKQKAEAGEAIVTTVLFDDDYQLLHDRIDIRGIKPITEKDYYVRGSTALLDALGRTISKIGNAQRHTSDELRAERVLFVITTDGMENASREYSYAKIRHMVERQQQKYGWEFIFLGANIDAFDTAGRMGIRADRTANYHADSVGTELNFAAVSDAVTQIRGQKAIREDWKACIDADYRSRKGKKN
ncbi:MAG TPA: hypothetical protein P5309_04840 [Syntrophomonadaceae bacterium]|nr:hypothetical protein [Syntrophomonadaceae bacterium]